MRIRGARKEDLGLITALFEEYDFKLDSPHLERMLVAEDEDGNIVAIMSLNTLLECCFLTVSSSRNRDKVEALKRLVEHGKQEVRILHYDLVHAFSNDAIKDILVKHFGFTPAKGTNLILFVE